MRLTPEQIARVCYEANRAYRDVLGEAGENPPWDGADEATRQSIVVGVAHAMRGLSPEAMHVKWVDAKYRDGWVYGPTRNTVTKEHPSLVPYHELPAEQRSKDYLFSAVVRALTYHA